jgi:hypothetical protein
MCPHVEGKYCMKKLLGVYAGEGTLGGMPHLFLGPWHSGYPKYIVLEILQGTWNL